MTTPNDPSDPAVPGGDSPAATPPGYGTPAGYGAPGGYGAPQGYGAPPGYGAPGYPPPGAAPYGGAQLAGWGARVGAALLDTLIGAGIYIGAIILAAIAHTASDALAGIFWLLGIVSAIAFTFWNNYRMGVTGQTIGKKQLGIYVRKEADGSFVGGGMGIARGFIHIIDSVPCIPVGYLWPLWDAKKQTFTDKVMGTVVVKG